MRPNSFEGRQNENRLVPHIPTGDRVASAVLWSTIVFSHSLSLSDDFRRLASESLLH